MRVSNPLSRMTGVLQTPLSPCSTRHGGRYSIRNWHNWMRPRLADGWSTSLSFTFHMAEDKGVEPSGQSLAQFSRLVTHQRVLSSICTSDRHRTCTAQRPSDFKSDMYYQFHHGGKSKSLLRVTPTYFILRWRRFQPRTPDGSRTRKTLDSKSSDFASLPTGV